MTAALADTTIREVPPQSNRGPKIDRSLAFCGLQPGYAYCAAMVSLWLHGPVTITLAGREVHLPPVGSPTTISPRARDFINDQAIPARKVLQGRVTPQAGWLVVWRRGSSPLGHIGILLKVLGDNDFLVLEANTGPGRTAGRTGGEGVHVRVRTIQPFAHFRIVAFVPVRYVPAGCDVHDPGREAAR